MIRKYPDACEHLHDVGGAYLWRQDYEWGNLNLSRCLAECDKDCPKKRNKKELSVGCWFINKRVREKYIHEYVRKMK